MPGNRNLLDLQLEAIVKDFMGGLVLAIILIFLYKMGAGG